MKSSLQYKVICVNRKNEAGNFAWIFQRGLFVEYALACSLTSLSRHELGRAEDGRDEAGEG
jgi:hypothetical protein